MTPEKPTRGGKRPGAGAPRGNKNAIRTGRYVEDKALRRALLRVPPEEREPLLRAIRKHGPLTRSRNVDEIPTPKNVIRLPSAAAAATEQSNAPLMATAAALTMHGFFGALPFLRRHFPSAPAVDQVLDHLATLAVEDPEEYAKIRSKGAFIRAMFHELTATIHEDLLYCRFCDWNQPRLFTKEHTA